MESDTKGNEGYYQERDFPERLALRAAYAAETPEQLSLGAFGNPESTSRAIAARKAATFARQSREQSILDRARDRRT